jgi:ribosomal protein S12 methylthiotransferase
MLARLMEAGGQVSSDPADADIIVVNTCCFIESATDEAIDTILALAAYKKKGRCRRLIVTGCLPERFREETAAALPEVDIFLGTGAFERIVDAVQDGLNQGTCLLPDPDNIHSDQPLPRKPFCPHSAYLKIAEGCSRHCTYCIIPKLRGRMKSRPLESLISEAKDLIGRGVKELTLVAQESTAFGTDLKPATDLPRLLQRLAEIDPAVWIRFLYGHPESLTQAVARTVADHPNLCAYFDVPIQHAADNILRRMGRRYTRADLLCLFETLRGILPDAALRTTVLVGFPGETKRDFKALVDFVEQVGFDHLGVFAYSDAEDLPAHHLAGHVPPEAAQERLEELMACQQSISARKLQKRLGHVVEVLVEALDDEGQWVARCQRQAPEVDGTVLIPADLAKRRLVCGRFEKVRIIKTLEYDMVGELVE